MTGTGDGKKLSQAFDDGESNCLNVGHVRQLYVEDRWWCNMDLMWLFNKKKKVGLVLGSGGARGVAHVGVIKTLLKHNVPIDLIVGSSSGAMVGGMLAMGKEIGDIEELVNKVSFRDVIKILADPVSGGGLVRGNRTLDYLKNIFGERQFEEMKTPFAAVATDVNSAEAVVLSRGSVAEAVRASMSVPLIYAPVKYNKYLLVDGGVSCPVPVEIAKEMGAEIVIAVNLDGVYFSGDNSKNSVAGSTLSILKNSYLALRYNLAKKEVREAEVVIEPIMKYVSSFNFSGTKEMIAAGEEAVEREIGRIKKLLR
jgi:NTE family protein